MIARLIRYAALVSTLVLPARAQDGAGLAAGVYVVRAEGAGGTAAQRVVRY